jgi:hypothetical protein
MLGSVPIVWKMVPITASFVAAREEKSTPVVAVLAVREREEQASESNNNPEAKRKRTFWRDILIPFRFLKIGLIGVF